MHFLAALWLAMTTPAGTTTVEVRPRLHVVHREAAPRAAAKLPPRCAGGWLTTDGPGARTALARACGPTFTADVKLEWHEGEVGVLLSVEITYLAAVRVEREALALEVPADAVEAVQRDGRFGPVAAGAPLVVDALTPRLCRVRRGAATLLVDGNGAPGLEVRRDRRSVTITLELDDARQHPFAVERRCRQSWRRAGARRDESARYHAPGEKASYRARLTANAEPLLLGRLPGGRRAALIVSDHADQTSLPTLRALLFGTSDERDPAFGRGGFLGHGLGLTKAFFRRGGPERPQLEDPAVFALAERLVRAGGEAALHSPTPAPDLRAVTEEALAFVRPLHMVTWIDHQPATNCEAFAAGGWRPGDPYYVADLLAAAGVRSVWTADVRRSDDLNLLRPREPAAHTPVLFPQAPAASGAPAGLTLFRSTWAYVDAARFVRLLAPPRLDRLEEERGIAILHTYLEAMRPEGRLRGRNLVRVVRPGVVALEPRLEAVLADLERRAATGRLWVTTVRDLGDFLRARGGLEVRYAADGSAAVRNAGPAAVRGVTVHVPRTDTRLEVTPTIGHRPAAPASAEVVLDLAPGATVRIVARTAAGRPVPLAAPASFRFLTAVARPAPTRRPEPPRAPR